MQYDFRSVYSTILRDWFCVSSSDVTTMLFNNYQYLPFINGNACNNNYDDLNNAGNNLISNYPNPFNASTTITFKTNGGHTLVQIFDTGGRLVMMPVDQDYSQGTYNRDHQSTRLPSASGCLLCPPAKPIRSTGKDPAQTEPMRQFLFYQDP